MKHLIALILGTLFGLILVKAEVLSWFRIQEMFAFQSVHMYGIIGSAVAVGASRKGAFHECSQIHYAVISRARPAAVAMPLLLLPL